MDVLALSLALATIVVVVVAFRMYRRGRVRQVEWWHALAKQHGLAVSNPGEPHEVELEGEYRGIRVKVSMGGGHSGTRHRLHTHATAMLPGGCPPGLLLTTHSLMGRFSREKLAPAIDIDDPELAKAYRIYGADEEKTDDVLATGDLRALLLSAAKLADFVRVDARGVSMEKVGVLDEQLPRFVDLTCRIAAALSEAHDRPWAQFARQHGLVFKGGGGAGVARALRGHINGRRVAIEMGTVAGEENQTFTTIRVGIGARLPAGFRVVPKGTEASRGSFEVGVPNLDKVVQIVGTGREQVIALLRHPPLRDHLIAFYDVCPYTLIENNNVIAGGPGLMTGDMESQVSAVMDLANAIRSAWATVRPSQGGTRAARG